MGRFKYGAAWRRWREMMREAGEHRELLNKAANFFLNKGKAACFYTWRDNARNIADVRFRVSGFIARLKNKELSAAGEVAKLHRRPTRGAVVAARDDVVGQQGSSRRVRAMGRVRGGGATGAQRASILHPPRDPQGVPALVGLHREQARVRGDAVQGGSPLRQQDSVGAFQRWLEFCEQAQMARRAMNYFVNGALLRALQTWSSASSRRRRSARRCGRRSGLCKTPRFERRLRGGKSTRWNPSSSRRNSPRR